MRLYPRIVYSTKTFRDPILLVVGLWCTGLFCGAGFAFLPGLRHLMLIQTLISSDYSFYPPLLLNLSLLLIPSAFGLFHLPCRCLICGLSFVKGFALGFFQFMCLFTSVKNGWILCLVLHFSSWVTAAPILDYWIKCFSAEYESQLPLLIRRCFVIISIQLFEFFVIIPMLVRIF